MNIIVSGNIILQADATAVFLYLADLSNDKFWRKEISETILSAKPGLHVTATETSYLSKRVPKHVLSLICIAYSEPATVIYETLPESKFYLKSTRLVEAVSKGQSRFTYSLEFDPLVVKHALGFSLPLFLIRWVAQSDLKKYLSQLKTCFGGN